MSSRPEPYIRITQSPAKGRMFATIVNADEDDWVETLIHLINWQGPTADVVVVDGGVEFTPVTQYQTEEHLNMKLREYFEDRELEKKRGY